MTSTTVTRTRETDSDASSNLRRRVDSVPRSRKKPGSTMSQVHVIPNTSSNSGIGTSRTGESVRKRKNKSNRERLERSTNRLPNHPGNALSSSSPVVDTWPTALRTSVMTDRRSAVYASNLPRPMESVYHRRKRRYSTREFTFSSAHGIFTAVDVDEESADDEHYHSYASSSSFVTQGRKQYQALIPSVYRADIALQMRSTSSHIQDHTGNGHTTNDILPRLQNMRPFKLSSTTKFQYKSS